MESCYGAMYLDDGTPPDDRRKALKMLAGLIRSCFVDAKRHQRTGIPKGRPLAHNPSSLSLSNASTARLEGTLPVGIFHNAAASSGPFGKRIFPAATSRSSSSVASPAENGTNFAIGKFRSRMTTSSPFRAKLKYALRRFLSSATFTLFMSAPHGHYSHEAERSRIPT